MNIRWRKHIAKLSTKARKKLPKSDFGEPGKRAYPMPDKAHARNAKARAAQQYKKGKLSASAKTKIDAKANRKLMDGEDEVAEEAELEAEISEATGESAGE